MDVWAFSLVTRAINVRIFVNLTEVTSPYCTKHVEYCALNNHWETSGDARWKKSQLTRRSSVIDAITSQVKAVISRPPFPPLELLASRMSGATNIGCPTEV